MITETKLQTKTQISKMDIYREIEGAINDGISHANRYFQGAKLVALDKCEILPDDKVKITLKGFYLFSQPIAILDMDREDINALSFELSDFIYEVTNRING